MTRCLIACFAALGLAAVPGQPAKPAGLRAGAFAQDVIPTAFPVSVNGGMADRQATSATTESHAARSSSRAAGSSTELGFRRSPWATTMSQAAGALIS